MKKVDIIIPIYNAIDDLKICLESIYKNTDLTKHRLVLVNDKSPDEKMKPFLDAQVRENVIVIHNEVNKGFSNNINIGMSQSDENDVILLNSDTVVTANWVEKMLECAYSSKEIGTVTPLSNNATLCSVPIDYDENQLPEGMSIDQMAELVEKCSLRKYPRISVAHGFCMMVKRDVIRTIGNFDAETFGRGYGEENDFCNRAEQMGFINVMCDDTYIYHSGTKSFVSKEKEEYMRQHEKILIDRYQKQMTNNHMQWVNRPNRWVAQNVAFHMDLCNGKKNVLYLLQSDFRVGSNDNVGGVQLHVKHLTQHLRNDVNIIVAARDREYLQVTAYIGEKEHLLRFDIGPSEGYPLLRNKKIADVFADVLTGLHIDLVHVHHTATTSLDIYYVAQELGIPVVYTAHDFYYVCPGLIMMDVSGKVCVDQENPDCIKCLRARVGIYEKIPYMNMWREQHAKALELCCKIITPSESTKDILAKYYPEQKDKIKVIPHGMDPLGILEVKDEELNKTEKLIWDIEAVNREETCIFMAGTAYMQGEEQQKAKVILELKDCNGKIIYLPTNYGQNFFSVGNEGRFFAYLPNSTLSDGNIEVRVILQKDGQYYIHENKCSILENCQFRRSDKFKVAFIGGINEEKGGKEIAELIKKGPDDVEWYVFGGVGEEHLYQLKHLNLVKTSYYYQEDVLTLLKHHNIDAICILSKGPETFSYTLSEAAISGIPVIVTDVGALGQRMRKGGFGVTVSVDEKKIVSETLETIQMWKTKGPEYQAVLEQQKAYKHPDMAEMSKDYHVLYEQVATDKKALIGIASLNERIRKARILTEAKGRDESELLNRISDLENRLAMINNSLTFKIVLKLTSMKIPFKKQLKKLLGKR